MGLPVIVERNAWTLAQEVFNTEWIVDNGVGIVTRDFRRVADAVRELLEPGRYSRYQANAAAMENSAVFEIPEMLEEVLAERLGVRDADVGEPVAG